MRETSEEVNCTSNPTEIYGKQAINNGVIFHDIIVHFLQLLSALIISPNCTDSISSYLFCWEKKHVKKLLNLIQSKTVTELRTICKLIIKFLNSIREGNSWKRELYAMIKASFSNEVHKTICFV